MFHYLTEGKGVSQLVNNCLKDTSYEIYKNLNLKFKIQFKSKCNPKPINPWSGIKEPFLRPELADRLAAMLDAVLEQLTNGANHPVVQSFHPAISFFHPEISVPSFLSLLHSRFVPGPKCRNLKVKNPEKYSWDPKWLLSHLIDIYLHLDSEKLTIAIANDQRAFKLTTFQDTARRMEATLGRWGVVEVVVEVVVLTVVVLVLVVTLAPRSATDVGQFAALGEAANRLVVQRMKQEVEWADVPEDFQCALMAELMEEPVILPSGNRCDRKNIERHILSTPNDPFNRCILNTLATSRTSPRFKSILIFIDHKFIDNM